MTRLPVSGLSVGYYARRDKGRHIATKVHVHRAGRGPICGARLHPEMAYQWCSHSTTAYVECRSCLRALDAPRTTTLREEMARR